MSEKSNVWKHFEKKSSDSVTCKICSHITKCKGSSTSGMITHLRTVHSIVVKRKNELQMSTGVETLGPSSKQPSLANFLIRESLAEIISKMASVDCISIRAITRSSFIRQSISKLGYSLPKNETDVMRIIHEFYETKKIELIDSLEQGKDDGIRYSLTLDEWSSIRMRRYFNINLHAKDGVTHNLGLVRIFGSCDATKTKQLVYDHLSSFNINYESDIVVTSMDGASVMLKFGREIPSDVQICLNHGINLAINDILHNKIKRQVQKETLDADNNEDDDEYDDFSEYDEEINQSLEFSEEELETDESLLILLQDNIKLVRKVVNFFKKSTVRSNIFQNTVRRVHGKELQLLLDCRTRWNSIEIMLDRFLFLKDCIDEGLETLNASHLMIGIDVVLLNNLKEILNITKLSIEALSRKDATILSAEGVLLFLLQKIRNMESRLANKFYVSLKARIDERRNTLLASLGKYLQNPENFSNTSTNTNMLPYSSKTNIIKYAKDLFKRLFPQKAETNTNSSVRCQKNDDEEIEVSIKEPISLSAELCIAIAHSMKESNPKTNLNCIEKEFQILEGTGRRTDNLKLIYEAICSAKPTSTDSERAFSVAGHFCSKIRSRLSDKSLNALMFLKYYFLKDNK